jgi:hypothetical protein
MERPCTYLPRVLSIPRTQKNFLAHSGVYHSAPLDGVAKKYWQHLPPAARR